MQEHVKKVKSKRIKNLFIAKSIIRHPILGKYIENQGIVPELYKDMKKNDIMLYDFTNVGIDLVTFLPYGNLVQ